MPRRRKPYPPEFRKQMVELVRAGRTPYELAKEFETTAQTIANWVIQAERTRVSPRPKKENTRDSVGKTSGCDWEGGYWQKPPPGRYHQRLRVRKTQPNPIPRGLKVKIQVILWLYGL